MTTLDAFLEGIRRVSRAKRYIFVVYLVNLLLAIVLGLALAHSIQSSLGHSMASVNLQKGFDDLWYRSYSAQATGLESTFEPGVVGIGAVFNGLDAFISGEFVRNETTILGVALLYLLLWTFFAAGFIAIYSATEESPGFFKQSARFFPRFFVLFIMAGVLYFLLFNFVLGWLSGLVDSLTRNTLDERIHFAYTLGKYLVFLLLLWFVNMLFDYSKIVTVKDNHKNALTAPFKALAFVLPNFGRTYRLYLSLGLVWIAFMLLYWLVAPGAGQSTALAIFGAFLLGQIYLLTRIWTRCLFLGSQTAMISGPPSTEQEAVGQ